MIFTNTLTKRKKQKLLYNQRVNNNMSTNIPIINNNLLITNNNNSIKMVLNDETNKEILSNNNSLHTSFKLNQNITNNLHNINYSEPKLVQTNINVSLDVNKNISSFIEKSNTLNTVKETIVLEQVKKQINYDKLNYVLENIKLIINTYQEEYANNKKASGLGDFIRGSYYLIQFCTKYKIKYNIDFSNHPLRNYLNKTNKNTTISYNSVLPFSKNNFIPEILDNNTLNSKIDDETDAFFIDYLYEQYNNIKIKIDTLFVYVIAFPNEVINNNDKQIMRYILEPNNIIKQKVLNILNNLSFKYKEYIIIHVRCGDNLLVNKETKFSLQCINNIFNELDNLFASTSNSTNNNYLLLADNNYIKKIILNKYTNTSIKTNFNEITHLGEGVILTTNAVENTMIEFYLISLSKSVFSMSIYKHGTGFSKWCAETYNIPYICKFIG